MSATGLAIGLCVDLQRPWSEIRLIGEVADSAGWHSIYVPDHFMPHETGNRAAGGPVLESWTCLTGLAMVTRQISIGTLVLGQSSTVWAANERRVFLKGLLASNDSSRVSCGS